MEARVSDEAGREIGRFRVCAGPLDRLRGLMFRRDLPADGLLFVFPAWRRHPRLVGVHTFFVFFPIAAIWLDEEGRIVHAIEARPFRVYAPPRPARYLIEGRPALLAWARPGARWTIRLPELSPGGLSRLWRGGIRADGGLFLVELVLVDLEETLGRPPGLRDLLRGLREAYPDSSPDSIPHLFWGGLRGAIRALSRDGARPLAARLGELLRELPETLPEPGWARARDAACAALDGLDPDEAVAGWRGLALFEWERGGPWTRWEEFRGFPCVVCGSPGGWAGVFSTRARRGVPAAMAWRLRRPEAFIPLCDRCRKRKIDRHALAESVWGPRFAALARWLEAVRAGRLPPDWDRRRFPLWPPEYGGRTWEEGSPAFPRGVAIRPPRF